MNLNRQRARTLFCKLKNGLGNLLYLRLKSNLKSIHRDERGSISLLVITLFLIAISMILISVNVASVSLAKRSLTQATEAAAQRGVRNLDKAAYYSGEFDLSTQVQNLFGVGPSDPGIPIDCSKAKNDAQGAIADWSNGSDSLKRIEISDFSLVSIECDGFGIQLVTSARSKLPMQLAFFGLESVEISARVSVTNKRTGGFAPFGKRIS
jgi:hypothetical protein